MRRSAVPFVAIVAAAALVGLLVYGIASRGASRTLDDAVASGQRPAAPVRALPVLGGRGERSLADFRGRPVLMNFWASWCDPCNAEAPLLERAQHRLAAHDGTVLGVTYNDTSGDSLRFLRQHGLTYPNLRDVGGQLARAYGTQGLPESFAVDARGRVVYVWRGQLTDVQLRRALSRLGV